MSQNLLSPICPAVLAAPDDMPSAADDPLVPPAFYSKREVLDLIGITYPALWAWMRQGRFPRGVLLAGGPHVRWHRAEVDQWIANQRRQQFISDDDAPETANERMTALASASVAKRKADAEALERKAAAAVTRAPRGLGRRRKKHA